MNPYILVLSLFVFNVLGLVVGYFLGKRNHYYTHEERWDANSHVVKKTKGIHEQKQNMEKN